MRIVAHRGDTGGVEMELVVVDKDGRYFVYFKPVGAAGVQPNAPHFVVAHDRTYGDLQGNMEYFRNAFEEFVCPDFADREELKTLRGEYENLKRRQISEQEIEALHADRKELEIFRAEERERAQMKARQAVLDTPRDKRSKGA